jgi:hypothetical protein
MGASRPNLPLNSNHSYWLLQQQRDRENKNQRCIFFLAFIVFDEENQQTS